MIYNFKMSSNLFRNRIYIAWFKRYLKIGCVFKKFFLKAVLHVTFDAFQEKNMCKQLLRGMSIISRGERGKERQYQRKKDIFRRPQKTRLTDRDIAN